MPKLGLETVHRVEYLILINPHPDGPILGFFKDIPIASAVIDDFGRRYVYAGVASRRRNGQYDIDTLTRGEWLVEPGLVYRCETSKPRRKRQ